MVVKPRAKDKATSKRTVWLVFYEGDDIDEASIYTEKALLEALQNDEFDGEYNFLKVTDPEEYVLVYEKADSIPDFLQRKK